MTKKRAETSYPREQGLKLMYWRFIMDEKRSFEVLLEDVLKKIELLSEGQNSLHDKVDAGFSKINNDINIIKTYMYSIDDNLNEYEKRLKKLEGA